MERIWQVSHTLDITTEQSTIIARPLLCANSQCRRIMMMIQINPIGSSTAQGCTNEIKLLKSTPSERRICF